jgi:hypothetical protein
VHHDFISIIRNPASWHRAICWAHPRLIVTGDLATHPSAHCPQLRHWRDAGVTHIVDVRQEWSDASLVSELAPEINYVHVGTDDMGNRRSDAWFEGVLDQLGDAIHDPYSVILVHCHMGVNRGPSMALRIMLEQGWDAIDAIEAIRAARPIAAVIYAADAVDHFHRCHGTPDTDRVRDRRRVMRWLDDDDVDVGWIISRIRRAE